MELSSKRARSFYQGKKQRLYICGGLVCLLLAACGPKNARTEPDREKDPQYLYEKAVVAMKYDLPDLAIDFLRQALSLDPDHFPSHNLLGVVYHKKQNYQAAAEALRRALEINPDSSETHHNLGVVCQDMGLPDQAEKEYRKAVDLGYSQSLFLLARLLFEQKKYDEAFGFGLKAMEVNPKDPAVYNLLGVLSNEKQDYRKAVTYLEKALQLSPGDPVVMVNLGIAHLNLGEKTEARQFLEKALPSIKDPALLEKVKAWLKEIKLVP